MKYTFNYIIDSLPVKKNSKSSWWVKLWVRKASFFFTYLFINMGWSSNAVSYLSIIVALAACTCFCIPSTPCVIAGVVLINFWLILDCVDGNIARCLKQKKLYGEFVDAMSGYYTVAFVYMALGVAAYNQSDTYFSNNILIVIIGAVASICDILARLIFSNYCTVHRPDLKDNAEKAKNDEKGSINYIRKRVSKELGVSGMFMPLTIVGLCLNCYAWIVIFYVCFNGFALLSTTIMYAYKADKYDSLNKLV